MVSNFYDMPAGAKGILATQKRQRHMDSAHLYITQMRTTCIVPQSFSYHDLLRYLNMVFLDQIHRNGR
ncbi:hypothetical protein DIJ64_00440 [Mycobacterium leprae]|uniref:Uncharacterized protein n=1 Tax=Mycobacterium leprae TaxID=1769 RepID=A0AAD0KTF8_MYCLR|nr:hypothetical protein DIJ64_00440 [Mycobacterium leprae]OAR21312.1 hypothetical protein A8144_06815 [Mycobacterium leprae 3125609]OAX71397.1 hypothetical protein A3216_05990 [Mycobacterium leprae 7935681]